jgi:hypothetical protein
MPYNEKVEPSLKLPFDLITVKELIAAVERHKDAFVLTSLLAALPLVIAVL